MKKQMKQMIIIFFLVILLTLLTTGCNENANIAEKPQFDFRITWDRSSGRGETISTIVERYNMKSESLCTVNVVSGNEDEKEIEAHIELGEADIFLLPYRYVMHMGEEGLLKSYGTDLETEMHSIHDEILELGKVNEEYYGVPWLGHSMALVYNKDLLDEAGIVIDEIKDLDSLVKALEKIQNLTDAKGIGLVGADHNDVSWMVNQFVYTMGSTLVDTESGKVNANNTDTASAIRFYRDVLGYYAQIGWEDDDGMDVMELFRDGKVAFEIQGPWGVTDIWKNGSPFEVGVIALKDIGVRSEVGPMMISLPADMDEESYSAALDFIKYLVSIEAQERIMDGEYIPEKDAYYPFRVPVRNDMADSQFFKLFPEFMPFVEGFSHASIDVPAPSWQTVKAEIYEPGLHKVMKREMTIYDFLEELQREGNELMK